MTSTSTTITIGSQRINIQILQCSDQRDRRVRGINAAPTPLPIGEWPLTPEAIEAAGNAKLVSSGARADHRDDCVWCLTSSLDHSPEFVARNLIIREATTAPQREAAQNTARRAYLRGELG